VSELRDRVFDILDKAADWHWAVAHEMCASDGLGPEEATDAIMALIESERAERDALQKTGEVLVNELLAFEADLGDPFWGGFVKNVLPALQSFRVALAESAPQMRHGDISGDAAQLIDWTRPRWMTGEGEIETARKLERNGLGKVFDDGDGGPVWWWPFGADALRCR